MLLHGKYILTPETEFDIFLVKKYNMKDNYTANKYTNGILGEHIPKRKFQLFKRGATSPGVYSSMV